ncbi:MAG: DUF1080 domain-containing protein [Planctomycetes bacterium]|nr:DUF1080 domain-containing protein [Planctomycetota bacterium]
MRVVTPADEELNDGWIALFDGQTLFGWEPGSVANWSVQDGVISVNEGEPGLLCTTSEFADYRLRLDFKFESGTNSGVFLHTPLVPTDPEKDCYELNIAQPDVSPFPTGSFVKRQKADGQFAPGEWHTIDVELRGGQATVRIDQQMVLEYVDPRPLLRGRIGLQLNKGKVEFRNIRLKPLGLEPLFNGVDLNGWAATPASPATEIFRVDEDQSIRARGGKGQLETQSVYGDFVLRIECKTNAPLLNSGLFFRCIPHETLNGYESQVHNGFREGNRQLPIDCGTGGIFRRVDARIVVPDDGVWFHKTIVANGPHIAVWVSGFQVTDWTDRRPPDPNPRKGYRSEPGSIMLQAHDETTDVSFRQVQAVELRPRAEP